MPKYEQRPRFTKIEKPWGYELILENNGDYVIKLLHVAQGRRLSLQYHEVKRETLIYWSGDGVVELGDDDFRMSSGVMIPVAPTQIHRIRASEHSHLEILEVSTPHLTDVVRIDDDYDRPNRD